MNEYKIIDENGTKILIYDNERIKVLIDEAALKKKVKELGAQLTEDYRDKDPVIISVFL